MELQAVVNYHVVAGNKSRSSATATSAPKPCAISLASVLQFYTVDTAAFICSGLYSWGSFSPQTIPFVFFLSQLATFHYRSA